ncbi:hypothetical protein QYE76_032040 [Lolium multiflorum]|uniref:Uncharacterized protein n=1 Tax=Lolium multiflorum TaxID=4521 RepID=A0AAD8QV17_LOLMU|nr:hypothetical protein QYE76_032040 [Lolium multiflorum]
MFPCPRINEVLPPVASAVVISTTYRAHLFRRRYLMRLSLFVRIVKDCELHSNYFKQRRNAAGVMGFSAFQKISAAMRVIVYGIPADYTDEYLRIGEDTTTESVRRFARMIIKLYGPPNEDDKVGTTFEISSDRLFITDWEIGLESEEN